jgi:hypothetical protein
MSRSITSSDANGATFETVGSTGGFSAGDLIYYGTTGYGKIPASSLPTTATSSLTKAYPTLPTNGTSGGYFQPTNFNSLGFSRSVALLFSGNAVAVYGNPVDGYPYFVIFNPTTRAIVAGPTVISTTFTMTGAGATGGYNIGVTAYSGGNFVVYWGNNAGGTTSRVNYATYTDAGVVVVAPTNDASLAVNNAPNGHMRGITLANGGFVLAYGNNTLDISFRAYNAAGVGQFAWVTLSSFGSTTDSGTNPCWGMTARSDNTYLIASQSNTASTYNYAIYNYAGTAVVATTTFTTVLSGGTNGKLDCATLSDGTTFVIAYVGQTATSTQGWNFRFLPTGNVLGSAFFLQGNFNSSAGNPSANLVRVWPLSSSRFLITGQDASSSGAYAVFNSSGTPLLGTSGTLGTASNIRSFGSYYQVNVPVLGVIESGGNAEVYLNSRVSSNTSSTNFCRISLTTYNMVSTSTASAALNIPVASTPASGYAGTNSTPSKASFALSNGVYPYAPKLSSGASATASGVYPIPVSVVNNVNSYDMCVLSNGNIAVVANQSSNTIVYIYNPITLAVINSATLNSIAGTSWTSGDTNTPNVRITPLSGGSFCLAVGTSTTNLRLTAFTSALVQQGSTVNITTVAQTFGTSSENFALCTISGDRVVAVYLTTLTNLNYAVYSNTLAVVVAGTTAASDGGGVQSNAVCATPNGFTVSAYRVTANTYNFYTFFEYSANLFTQPAYATASPFSSISTVYLFTVANNNGVVYTAVRNSATTAYLYAMWGGTSTSVTSISTTAVSTLSVCCGITASGMPYLIWQDTTDKTTGVQSVGMAQVSSLTGWTSPTGRVSTAQIRSIPLYGNMVLVASLVDTNSALAFGTLQINGSPDSAVFTTADTTNNVPVYPLATTTVSPAITNNTFAGVAVTDCIAGGTGVIQTTGATNLNSTYPTTTAQTFDYTGQAAPGLKGTISGRSISMRKS